MINVDMAVEDSVRFSKDDLTFIEEPPKQIEISNTSQFTGYVK